MGGFLAEARKRLPFAAEVETQFRFVDSDGRHRRQLIDSLHYEGKHC